MIGVVLRTQNTSDNKVFSTFEIGREQNGSSQRSDNNPFSVILDGSDSKIHFASSSPKHTTALTFPMQLHSLLEAAEREGFDHIVSWLDDTTFKIHDPNLFVKHVMPRYFKRQSKYKSFQRQLNLWQFQRLTRARGLSCTSGYFHAYFHRRNNTLIHCMKRSTIKQKGARDNDLPVVYLVEDSLEMQSVEEQGIQCTTATTNHLPRDMNSSYIYAVSPQKKVGIKSPLLDCAIITPYHQATGSTGSSSALCSDQKFSGLHGHVVNRDASKLVQCSTKLVAQHVLPPLSHLHQEDEDMVVPPSLETIHHRCSWSPRNDGMDGDEKSLLHGMRSREEDILTEGGSPVLSAAEWKYVLVGIEMAMET